MKKLIIGLLILHCVGSLLLSGCGMRPCLHTDTGCETDSSENDKACQKFGGATTACHPVKPGARFVN